MCNAGPKLKELITLSLVDETYLRITKRLDPSCSDYYDRLDQIMKSRELAKQRMTNERTINGRTSNKR
jgi:hypothetical protein